MNFPCANKINACACSDQVNPLSNFSSELPDSITYRERSWFNPPVLLGDQPDDSTGYRRPSFDCDSLISQEDAQFCADIGSYLDRNGGIRTSGSGGVDSPSSFLNSPQTCVAYCPDGSFFSIQRGAGFFIGRSQAQANAAAFSDACRRAYALRICLGDLAQASACVDVPYYQTIPRVGGIPPLTYDIIGGSLPPGINPLQLTDGVTLALQGTPTAGGTYNFTVTARSSIDTNGQLATHNYTIEVLEITNAQSLPNGQANVPYSQQLLTAGGTAPFTFGVVDGALPPGLSLSSSGLIDGTPTYGNYGAFDCIVNFTDSTGISCTADVTITIDQPPGPDWSKLQWSYPKVQNPPFSTAAGNALGASAAGSLTKQIGFDFPQITPVLATLQGNYTGPACNCRITLTVTRAGTANAYTTGIVTQDGTQRGGSGAPANTSGTFIYNFSLIAGVNSVITVGDVAGNQWAEINQVGGAGSMTFTWFIQNV